MRDPRQYTPSLLIYQPVVTGVYLAIGCVVYYYCGSYVASPALGSAGPAMKKISYGFAWNPDVIPAHGLHVVLR